LILASGAAIGSKFLFKVNDKHFFNPANVGIVTVLLLTRDAWVSPGQWGTDGWCVLVFIGAAGIILGKVGRWDTSVIFLGCYACLEAVRNQWLGWSWDVWAHHLISGSLWVFALFMLTDPRSIPDACIGRVIWAMGIAALTFVLRYCFFIPTGMFWSLFALAPFTALLDHLWSTPRFSWLMPAAPREVQGEDPQMRDLQTGELPTVA
jgi:Na+-transporting NADH:ubiquinone oxidoreductase subunit NqrB